MIADARIGAAHERVLEGFRVHHKVYQARVRVGDQEAWHVVMSQNERYYVCMGSAISRDLVRYNFTDAETHAFDTWVKRENKQQKNRNEVKKEQCR